MLIPISYKLCFPFLIFIFERRHSTILWTVLFCTFMLLFTICSLEASLRLELANETSKAASQWDRIQQLQNDLIKVEKSLFTNYVVHFSVYVVYCLSLDVVAEEWQWGRANETSESSAAAGGGSAAPPGLLKKDGDFGGHSETAGKGEKCFPNAFTAAKCAFYEYPCAVLIFQIIGKMQKVLDSKLREENKQSADKRLVVKRQTGRLTQWSERDCMGSKRRLVRTSLHAE